MDERTKTQAAQGEAVASTGTPTPSPRVKRPYNRRLGNLDNVKKGLADLIRGVEDGKVDPGVARTLTYSYSTLANVIVSARELEDNEQRIAALEARVAEMSHGRPGSRPTPSFLTRPFTDGSTNMAAQA